MGAQHPPDGPNPQQGPGGQYPQQGPGGQYPPQGPGGYPPQQGPGGYPPQGGYYPQGPEQKPDRKGLIFGSIALVVALVVGGIALFVLLGDDGDDTVVTTPTETEAEAEPTSTPSAAPTPTPTPAPTPTAAPPAPAPAPPAPAPAPAPAAPPPPPPAPAPAPPVDQEIDYEIVAQVFWDDGSDFDARLITPNGDTIPAGSDSTGDCGALPPQEESVNYSGDDGVYTLQIQLFNACNLVDGSFGYEIYVDGTLVDSGGSTIFEGDTAAIDFSF